jgi:hypothetical protein
MGFRAIFCKATRVAVAAFFVSQLGFVFVYAGSAEAAKVTSNPSSSEPQTAASTGEPKALLPPPATPPVPPVIGNGGAVPPSTAPSAPPVTPPAPLKPAASVTNLRCWAGGIPLNGTITYFTNENIAIPETDSVKFEKVVGDLKFYLWYTNKSITTRGATIIMRIDDLKSGFKTFVEHSNKTFSPNGNINVRLMKADPTVPGNESGVIFACAQENPAVARPGWIN